MPPPEKLYVQVTKNVTKEGSHYYPNNEIKELNDKGEVDEKESEKKRNELMSHGYFYGKKSCEKVEVTEEEFFYFITRDKGVSACSKDVMYEDKTGDLKIIEKKDGKPRKVG